MAATGPDSRNSKPGPAAASARSDIVIAHSSDVHVDHHYTPTLFAGDGTGSLKVVIAAARKAQADLILLAGDTFDCHRLPVRLLEQTAEVLHGCDIPLVILPGNHDPAVDDAVYHHPVFADVKGLSVLGVTDDEAVHFRSLDLEIWGRPHRDYGDMDPFETARPRTTRWQVAMAHGHYTPEPDRSTRLRPSWLIGDDELNATAADYIALGHWNRWVKVGDGSIQAYYSGSPDYARTINVVRLGHNGDVSVERAALDLPEGFSAIAQD